MGREEIRRLCLTVWASPAVSPGGRAGCSDRHGIPFRYVPLPTRSHPAGCMSRAAAPLPLGAEPSRAGRPEGVRVFSGTAGTCRVRVRNPGALRGRLGGGVVAYVPRYGAYVTLSQVPREGALFPPHCSRRITPGRYASAAYHPAGGGTGPDMARILPGSRSENTGPSRYVALCRAACQGDPGGAGHFSRVSGCIRAVRGPNRGRFGLC